MSLNRRRFLESAGATVAGVSVLGGTAETVPFVSTFRHFDDAVLAEDNDRSTLVDQRDSS